MRLTIANAGHEELELSLDPWHTWTVIPADARAELAFELPPSGWADIAVQESSAFFLSWPGIELGIGVRSSGSTLPYEVYPAVDDGTDFRPHTVRAQSRVQTMSAGWLTLLTSDRPVIARAEDGRLIREFPECSELPVVADATAVVSLTIAPQQIDLHSRNGAFTDVG